jgi:hypothetical protein
MSMPYEKIAVKMNGLAFLDVGSCEVIESVPGAGNIGWVAQRLFDGLEAFDSVGVANPLPS